MLAVPVADSYDDNMELSLYCDSKKGDCSYLGLYVKKSIRAVGKVMKIVVFSKNENDDYDTNVAVTNDEKARFLELKRRVLRNDPQCNFGESKVKIYFVDKFYETDYKTVGKMGIMNSKKFFLYKLLPASTKEIAEQLDGQTWQLVKGQDIMPVRKNIPLVADEIMLAVPVSETYEVNTELNIYFSSSKDIHEYIGLYENKSIRAVGKIVKVIEFENVNGKILIKNAVTPEEESKVLEYKQLCEAKNPKYVFNSGKIYFVDRFYPTDYKNVGSDGIRNGKKIFLYKLLPASTAEIAEQLNDQTWELIKGEEIIPLPKPVEQSNVEINEQENVPTTNSKKQPPDLDIIDW